MTDVTIHNALADPEVAARFVQGIRRALEPVSGTFAAWVKAGESSPEVTIHVEEPARKETLGNVVEPWKRSGRVPLGASVDEVRRAVEKLLAT